MGFPGDSDGKESACNAGNPGSIPGSGRSLREGNGYPLEYSSLENYKDKGAWWATVHRVEKSWTRPSNFYFTFNTTYFIYFFIYLFLRHGVMVCLIREQQRFMKFLPKRHNLNLIKMMHQANSRGGTFYKITGQCSSKVSRSWNTKKHWGRNGFRLEVSKHERWIQGLILD